MPIIDLHCDTASLIYEEKASLLNNSFHVDLEKLKGAGYSAQWFAFFIHMQKLNGRRPMAVLEEMYSYFINQVAIHSDHIQIVTDYKSYEASKASGKVGAFLSIEEGQVIEGKIENLERLKEMGIRLMTLTWNYENDIGKPHHMDDGLTSFGKEVVDYLNHSPILLDISHLSEAALKDITKLYHKPIIASHSNARGYYRHTRNVSDEGIRQIAESGGIIGTNFYSYFLGNTRKTTLEMLRENIQYIHKIGGEDILALGTDFDGIDCDLEVCNCKEMDKLIHSISKVFPSYLVDKLCYKNAERVIKEHL